MSIANHKIGLEKIAALLMDRNTVINSTQDIDVVGHRVVHGASSLIQYMMMKKITQLSSWHRPQSSELEGIHVASAILHRQNKWL
jgi:acetate kinase